MSGLAMEWAIEQSTKTGSAKLVLLTLAHHKNHKSGECFPGVAKIANYSQCSERKVQQALNELEELELIKVIRAAGLKNHYELLTPADFAGRTDCGGAETTGEPPQNLHPTPEKNGTPFSIEQGKEQGKKQGEKSTPKKSPAKKPKPKKQPWESLDFSSWPGMPSDEVMAQWWKVRKAKRLVATDLAMEGVGEQLQEAARHGYTPEQCLKVAVVRSWGGFEFEWFLNHINKQQGGGFGKPAGGIDPQNTDWGESSGSNGSGQNTHQPAHGSIAGDFPRMGHGNQKPRAIQPDPPRMAHRIGGGGNQG